MRVSDGMRIMVPLREVKTDEKRRRENKECLRARVFLRQKKTVMTQGVGSGMYDASMTHALYKNRGALVRYKRYQLENEAMKVKAGTQCRKKEVVVPAL